MSHYLYTFCSLFLCLPSLVHIQNVAVESSRKKHWWPQGHRGRLYPTVKFELALKNKQWQKEMIFWAEEIALAEIKRWKAMKYSLSSF